MGLICGLVYNGSKQAAFAVRAKGGISVGILRKELRHNLLNAGAVLVGFATLEGNEKLPYPALTAVVSFAVKLEPADDSVWSFARAYFDAEPKMAMLAEHVKASVRRYGFNGEVMPKAVLDMEHPDTEFPSQAAAIAAGLAVRGEDGLLVTKDYGKLVRFGTVFTDATWKKNF